MRLARYLLISVCALVALPALFSQKLPKGLKGPIKEAIEKGDIVVGVVDRFRLPKTTDAIVEGATTHAHARIQYLNPVGDGSGRLAINDLRGPLYITDKNGESPQLYMDHRDYPLSFDASMMPNETGFAGFAFHPDFSKKGKPGYGKFYTAAEPARPIFATAAQKVLRVLPLHEGVDVGADETSHVLVDEVERCTAKSTELVHWWAEVAAAVQFFPCPGGFKGGGEFDDFVVGTLSLHCFEDFLCSNDAALHCCVGAFDFGEVQCAGVTANDEATREGHLRQAVQTALSDCAGAV